MSKQNFKYIYGPVASWRLGASLGVDPISQPEKICSFDCVYCQLGPTPELSSERKVFVPVAGIIEEINSLPDVRIDYITFSGRGEPTLAKNLGKMIRAVKKLRKEKVCVITNGSLIDRKDVQDDLMSADLVLVKLDSADAGILAAMNRPHPDIGFENIAEGLREFKARFKGRLAVQSMFVKENKDSAKKIAQLCRRIKPDEVELNTPLRPCAEKPLSREEMARITAIFSGLPMVCVYDARPPEVASLSGKDTLTRRGKTT